MRSQLLLSFSKTSPSKVAMTALTMDTNDGLAKLVFKEVQAEPKAKKKRRLRKSISVLCFEPTRGQQTKQIGYGARQRHSEVEYLPDKRSKP